MPQPSLNYDYNTPIPNNPFYSPETYQVRGAYYSMIVGCGIFVSSEGVISACGGGGGGGVTSITAGCGISINAPSGDVVISNTGVRSVNPGSGIAITGTANAPIITALYQGTVKQINTGCGLVGGPITNAGTIALAPSGVSAGSYTNANISIDCFGRVISASSGAGGGTGTVTQICTGTGLCGGPITTTGTICLTNTGVSAGQYTYARICVDAQGRLTCASSGTPPVTCISATCGITGGTITSTGVIGLSNTGVSAATYNNPTITVDAQGRITAASSGTALTALSVTVPLASTGGANPTLSICPASTSCCGAVKLSDSVSSTCSATAATSLAVKCAYDAAIAAIPKECILDKGYLITGTAFCTPAALAPGTPGQILYSCPSAPFGLCWADPGIISSVTCVTGVAPINVLNGSSTPQISIVGATTSVVGATRLATVPETQAGTSTTLAITPAGACATYVPLSLYPNKGDILIGTAAACIPSALTLAGTADGQVLTVDSACTHGVKWAPNAGAPVATTTVNGIITGCVNCTATSLGYCAGGATPNPSFNNTAIGFQAADALTNGYQNTVVGVDALGAASTAIDTTAIGFEAACSITTGYQNTAVGSCSLRAVTTTVNNTAIGFEAGRVVTGSGNTSIGSDSHFSLVNGECNTAIGHIAHSALTSGGCNVAIGFAAGSTSTSGNRNVLIGPYTQVVNLTGSCQLTIGFGCDLLTETWLTGDNTGAIKPAKGIRDLGDALGAAGQVLSSTGTNAVCWVTPYVPTAATPVCLGLVYGCTAGTNASLGYQANPLNYGANNVVIGRNAFLCALPTNGGGNIVIGASAMYCVENGAQNIAVGSSTLMANKDGNYNVAVGDGSLRISIGTCCNTALGNNTGCSLTTGFENVFVGINAGCQVTTGCQNVVIGPKVQVPDPAGSQQLAIGYSANNYWLTGCANKDIRPGAGILDYSGSPGNVGSVLVAAPSAFGNAIVWDSVGNVLNTPYYGKFYDTTTQTLATVSTPQAVLFGNVGSFGNGVFVNGIGVITITFGTISKGVPFVLSWSLQLQSTSGGGHDVESWVQEYPTNVTIPGSNRRVHIQNANEAQILTGSVMLLPPTGAASATYRIMWATNNVNAKLTSLTSLFGGPTIPSAYVEVVPVGQNPGT